MAYSETITLQYPFTFEGQEITEITIRRPKMRDMKKAQKHKDDMEKSIHMIADLAEVSPKLVEELDTEDFGAVSAKVGEFMGVSGEQTP